MQYDKAERLISSGARSYLRLVETFGARKKKRAPRKTFFRNRHHIVYLKRAFAIYTMCQFINLQRNVI